MTTIERRATFLPEPPMAEAGYTLISVDDHLIEPPELFEGRMPAALADETPRVIELEDGAQGWLVEGEVQPSPGLNAVAGRPPGEWRYDPTRFDEMRPGCYRIEDRLHDMDLAGVYASVCFPSYLAGFGGANFNRFANRDLGLACMRAWNDFHIDVWAGLAPERIVPLQVTWFHDPDLAAREIERNAARGFRAVSFPELPDELPGIPGLMSRHWDPIFRACEETETVVCLHTGSASYVLGGGPGWPVDLPTSLFPANALLASARFLWSGVPSRFPKIKIALSEGGIGWVPMYLDRLEYMESHAGQAMHGWDDHELSPVEVFRRNFWFCTLEDPSTLKLRDRIGVDRIMMEVDYPHSDTTWPKSQQSLARLLGAISEEDARRIAYANAAELFRHRLPTDPKVPAR
ncbi:MAG: amidohydrolase family protein [Acidimicrobiales bacterium]|nr:amidohydrolase family protein [Acidimicrobiales bacterium]